MAATLQVIRKARKKTERMSRARVCEPGSASPVNKSSSGRIPEVIQTLFSALTEQDLVRVAEVYREAMGATRSFWKDMGKDPKSGRARGRWIEEPDHKVRIAAANMVAAYREGLPVARQLTLNGSFQELSDLLEDMRSSGEAMRLLGPAAFELPNERPNESQK